MSVNKRARQAEHLQKHFRKDNRIAAAYYRRRWREERTDEYQLERLNKDGHGNCREAMKLYLRIRAKGK